MLLTTLTQQRLEARDLPQRRAMLCGEVVGVGPDYGSVSKGEFSGMSTRRSVFDYFERVL